MGVAGFALAGGVPQWEGNAKKKSGPKNISTQDQPPPCARIHPIGYRISVVAEGFRNIKKKKFVGKSKRVFFSFFSSYMPRG
jgi:hypothetical protein